MGPAPCEGLRREEVASLAGVSVEYYKRLERGNASGVSDGVLEARRSGAAARRRRAGTAFDLARAANPVARRRRCPAVQRVRPVALRILEAITAPAIVRNSRVDYLAANGLGHALYAPLFEGREQPPNSARFTFLDPAATEFSTGSARPRTWSRTCAPRPAAIPTTEVCPISSASCRPAARSSAPGGDAQRWLRPDRNQTPAPPGRRRTRAPIRGDGRLRPDDGLTISVYSAEPGSRSQEALDLLASWTATPERSPTAAESYRDLSCRSEELARHEYPCSNETGLAGHRGPVLRFATTRALGRLSSAPGRGGTVVRSRQSARSRRRSKHRCSESPTLLLIRARESTTLGVWGWGSIPANAGFRLRSAHGY